MKYIWTLTALIVLIGFSSEASEPIPALKTARQSTVKAKQAEPKGSEKTQTLQGLVLAKLAPNQEPSAQNSSSSAAAADAEPTMDVKLNQKDIPLSVSSVLILLTGLIGMVAIRRSFTP